MRLVVLLTADVPEVSRHGLFAIRVVLLRLERSEVLSHVAQVFATRLHGSRYRAEAVTCVDGVLGLRDVVAVGVTTADVQTRTFVTGGRCFAVRTDQVIAVVVTVLLFRLG